MPRVALGAGLAAGLFFVLSLRPAFSAAVPLPPGAPPQTPSTAPTLSPTPRPSATPTPTASPQPDLSLSRKLLATINKDRAKHRVAPLSLDLKQSECSRKHSRHMAALGALSHDQFPSDVCIPHSWAGENVGVAGGDPLSALLFLHHLMMTEGPCPHNPCRAAEFERHGHYLNLVNAFYKRIGIGIYTKGQTVWVTEDFTN